MTFQTAIPIYVPSSPTLSARSASPPPTLSSSTLALLDSFLHDKAEEDRKFRELAEKTAREKQRVIQDKEDALRVKGERDEEDRLVRVDQDLQEGMMGVDRYREIFGERFGLSQFWYSTKFANHLARSLFSLCDAPTTRVAFLCSPTAFVAFQHENPLERTLLFEYDDRFEVLAGNKFVRYDLNEPDAVPEKYKGTVDLAVVDPPYLRTATNENIAKTLSLLLNPNSSRLVIITSSTVPLLAETYASLPTLGPLRRVPQIEVEHESGLANDFACWGSWDGAEEWGVIKGEEIKA